MPTIAVVIPTFNEERYLPCLLNQLATQTMKPDEVIVADCNSLDGTVDVAKSFSKKLPLKIVQSRIHTAAAARNAGAKSAKSEYLLFVDADSSLPDNTVAQISGTLSDHPVDFVGVSFVSDGKHWIDIVLTFLVRLKMYTSMNITKHLWTIGGVMCVKRAMHKKAGGFNAMLDAHDDTDYAGRLRKAGASYIYLRNLRTITSSRRWQAHSLFHNLGNMLIYNSSLGRFFLHPLAKRLRKLREYGHYK